jgi:hypothetical protein
METTPLLMASNPHPRQPYKMDNTPRLHLSTRNLRPGLFVAVDGRRLPSYTPRHVWCKVVEVQYKRDSVICICEIGGNRIRMQYQHKVIQVQLW